MLRPNFNPNVGAKQLVVKNFKKKPRADPRQYFEQTWNTLQDALSKIFNGVKIDSLEVMYRGVENVCRQGFAPELSSKLKEKCRTYMETQLKKPLLDMAGGDDVEVLKSVLDAWRTWTNEQVMTLVLGSDDGVDTMYRKTFDDVSCFLTVHISYPRVIPSRNKPFLSFAQSFVRTAY